MKAILCWFGIHTWELSYYLSRRGGYCFSDRCVHCGIWHKKSIKHSWRVVDTD